MNARVLVTGATGFVGRHLCQALAARGYRVRAAVRASTSPVDGAVENVIVGEITARTDWAAALRGVDHVVHAAARVPEAGATEGGAVYEEANVAGTQSLTIACAGAQVRRLVFVSSLKVNGEASSGNPFAAGDIPKPASAYGRSKWQAEQFIMRSCATSSMEYVVIRPPLVYGPGVRATFLRLMKWISRGYPLPVATLRNRHSFVSLWNLVDLIEVSISNPAAAGRTWMVSDGEDLSIVELAAKIGAAMGRPARMFSVPEPLLRFGASIAGKDREFAVLRGSLRVDTTQTASLLGWHPPVSVDHGLTKTVEWFLSSR